jgi:hypothetical protein
MLVGLHVTIALSSIGYTTYLFIRPSQIKFYVSYGLIGLTIASGTYLVVSTHSRLLPACMAGLIYLGIMSVGVVLSHLRFKQVAVKVHQHDERS